MEFNRLLSQAIGFYGEPENENFKSDDGSNKQFKIDKENTKQFLKKKI